jgi:hypothetical protein
LSDRDLAVLDTIRDHRFLTVAHLVGFEFWAHRSHRVAVRVCQRVLQRLEADGLLVRAGRVGGRHAGRSPDIWRLSSQGLRLLNLRDGLGAVGRIEEPGRAFVQHYLAIADADLALVEADRQGRFDLLDVILEPRSWRRYLGSGGARLTLKPDLFVRTADPHYLAECFIEIDRETESIPTVLKQCRLYEDYRRTGAEQHRAELFPRVIWAVPDERRAHNIRHAILRSRDLDPDLFRVTTADRLADIVTAETTGQAPADTPPAGGQS